MSDLANFRVEVLGAISETNRTLNKSALAQARANTELEAARIELERARNERAENRDRLIKAEEKAKSCELCKDLQSRVVTLEASGSGSSGTIDAFVKWGALIAAIAAVVVAIAK